MCSRKCRNVVVSKSASTLSLPATRKPRNFINYIDDSDDSDGDDDDLEKSSSSNSSNTTRGAALTLFQRSHSLKRKDSFYRHQQQQKQFQKLQNQCNNNESSNSEANLATLTPNGDGNRISCREIFPSSQISHNNNNNTTCSTLGYRNPSFRKVATGDSGPGSNYKHQFTRSTNDLNSRAASNGTGDEFTDELSKLTKKLQDIESRLDKNEKRADKELRKLGIQRHTGDELKRKEWNDKQQQEQLHQRGSIDPSIHPSSSGVQFENCKFWALQRSSTTGTFSASSSLIHPQNLEEVVQRKNEEYQKDLEDELNEASSSFNKQLTELTIHSKAGNGNNSRKASSHNNEQETAVIKKATTRRSFGQRLQKSSSNVLRAATSSIHHVPSLILPRLKSEKRSASEYASMDCVTGHDVKAGTSGRKLSTCGVNTEAERSKFFSFKSHKNKASASKSQSVVCIPSEEEYFPQYFPGHKSRRSPLRILGNFVDDKIFRGRLSVGKITTRTSLADTCASSSGGTSRTGSLNDNLLSSDPESLAAAIISNSLKRSQNPNYYYNNNSHYGHPSTRDVICETRRSQSTSRGSVPSIDEVFHPVKLATRKNHLPPSTSHFASQDQIASSSSCGGRISSRSSEKKSKKSSSCRKYRAYSTPTSSRDLIQDLLSVQSDVTDETDDTSGNHDSEMIDSEEEEEDDDQEESESRSSETRADALAEIEAFERMASEFLSGNKM